MLMGLEKKLQEAAREYLTAQEVAAKKMAAWQEAREAVWKQWWKAQPGLPVENVPPIEANNTLVKR
jgi:hypothetical protein